MQNDQGTKKCPEFPSDGFKFKTEGMLYNSSCLLTMSENIIFSMHLTLRGQMHAT